MKLLNLVEVCSALHFSRYVVSDFPQRSGIILVGPPGSLGSTIINETLHYLPNTIVVSDLNVRQLMMLRDDVAARRITTIGIMDFEKIYQRHGSTASNVEGHIKGFADEGFFHTSMEDSRTIVLPAKAAILTKMTQKFYMTKYSDWIDNGFARRFIWCVYRLKDPEVIEESIHKWRKITFTSAKEFITKMPNAKIPMSCTEEESRTIRRMLNWQRAGIETPLIALKKILSVLKWKFGDKQKAMNCILDFAEGMSAKGGELEI